MSGFATLRLTVDPDDPDLAVIARAAAILRRGGLVAFPTETVYGLGALAGDANAVAGIFRAKGRPAGNPLIVHAADSAGAREVVAAWPTAAARLAEAFWPGPLTLVLPKSGAIPAIVTAGGATVGVRVPDHAVARALIHAAGGAVAAPSANRSNAVSPTRAEHVLHTLDGRIDALLNAGACRDGLESTVVAVPEGDRPLTLLRPGPISAARLAAVAGRGVDWNENAVDGCGDEAAGITTSPGRQPLHYAPATPCRLVDGHEIAKCAGPERRYAVIARAGDQPSGDLKNGAALMIELPGDAVGYARGLYEAMHRADVAGLDAILVMAVPRESDWDAVRDRLTRATA